MARSDWGKAARGVAAAKQLLAKYEYDPRRRPLLTENKALDDDLDAMLRRLK